MQKRPEVDAEGEKGQKRKRRRKKKAKKDQVLLNTLNVRSIDIECRAIEGNMDQGQG